MKKQLRKLALIGRFIDLSYFYSISVTEYSIKLQGEFNSVKVRELRKLFDLELNESGFVEGEKNNVRIVLT